VREAALFAVLLVLAIATLRAGLASEPVVRVRLPTTLAGASFALGCALACGGLLLMVRAQREMGASWCVGIDEHSRPGLVRHGLYGWTRNPIYCGACRPLPAAVSRRRGA
jgi:protein-S-isoprenylcysteine O-methyltransferase Ste14